MGLLFLKCCDYYTSSNDKTNPKYKLISGLLIIGLIIFSDLLHCDYGSYGLFTIFIFFKYLEPNGKENIIIMDFLSI